MDNKLSPTQLLSAENILLKSKLLDAEIQISNQNIKERTRTLQILKSTFEKEFRETLKPSETSKFNWDKLEFEEPK